MHSQGEATAPSTPGWTGERGDRGSLLGVIAFGLGAAIAALIAIFSVMRWRARRRGRVERLRRGARRAALNARTAAGAAALAAGSRASMLGGNVRPRRPAGAGLGLLAGLGLWMTMRRRMQMQEERRRPLMAEPQGGLAQLLTRMSSMWPIRQNGKLLMRPADVTMRERLMEPTSPWAVVGSLALAVMTGVIVWRSVARGQPGWADDGGMTTADGGVPASP
jgi:hypothetical protein